jgi:hypothetical protein
MRRLTWITPALPLLLTGCLGSVVAYRPGWEPRPEQETTEDEEQEALRLAVPAEIERHDWHLTQGRREVRRIFAESPRNPWNTYEEDVYTTLREEHAAPVLKDRLPAVKARLAPKPLGPTGPAKAEAAAEEGGGEGGGEE